MPDVTFTLSAAHLTRLINATTYHYGYSPTLEDGSQNPESAGAFTKRVWAERMRELVRYEEIEAEKREIVPGSPITIT